MTPPPKNKATCSSAPLITPSNTLAEATETARATRGTIKDADEAKKFLQKDGWTVEGEALSLETLARILLASSLASKNASDANIMMAIAYIITTNLQEGIAQEVARSIADLLKHSIATMTVDIRADLELHAAKLAESAQSQVSIAKDMRKTQEEMAESAKQAATQVKSYSQIVASAPPPLANPPSPTPP